jgi:hypothetical protein
MRKVILTLRLCAAWTVLLAMAGPVFAHDCDQADSAKAGDSFAFVDDAEAGVLTLQAAGEPIYGFVYKPKLKSGFAEAYRRMGYIHPLYGLDGHPLTKDFPSDHPHHRGLWVSWPKMEYEGQTVQLWHPSPLRQQFGRWLERDTGPDKATLELTNHWVLDGETIGHTRWRITTHRERSNYRAIDLTLTLRAGDKPIKLAGKPGRKGYGGLCLRTASDLKGGRLVTDSGPVKGDIVAKDHRWADLSNNKRGVAILAHPANPNNPPPWLVRNTYGGILNPQWPGRREVTLKPGHPIKLRYRMIVHRGDLSQEKLNILFKQWAEQDLK